MIVSKDFSYYRFRMPEGMKQRIEEKTLKRINLVSPNPIVKRFEEEFQGQDPFNFFGTMVAKPELQQQFRKTSISKKSSLTLKQTHSTSQRRTNVNKNNNNTNELCIVSSKKADGNSISQWPQQAEKSHEIQVESVPRLSETDHTQSPMLNQLKRNKPITLDINAFKKKKTKKGLIDSPVFQLQDNSHRQSSFFKRTNTLKVD